MGTLHSKHWRQHEYVNLFLRGTGRNNHNSSIFKIDDTVLLDHAFYMGFYLAILDRRDLALAYSGFFNTSSIENGYIVIDKLTGKTKPLPKLHDGFEYIDDFGISNKMAKIIKQYDSNYFVVVIS
jgi:hypothetical protein